LVNICLDKQHDEPPLHFVLFLVCCFSGSILWISSPFFRILSKQHHYGEDVPILSQIIEISILRVNPSKMLLKELTMSEKDEITIDERRKYLHKMWGLYRNA
jgi:hypothetical protein